MEYKEIIPFFDKKENKLTIKDNILTSLSFIELKEFNGTVQELMVEVRKYNYTRSAEINAPIIKAWIKSMELFSKMIQHTPKY